MKNYLKERFVSFLNKKIGKKCYPCKMFYIYRGIASFFIDFNASTKIAFDVGRFYATKTNMKYIPLQDIFVLGDTLWLGTMCPGMFIGKYGKNIDDLLNDELNQYNIKEVRFIDFGKPMTHVESFVAGLRFDNLW